MSRSGVVALSLALLTNPDVQLERHNQNTALPVREMSEEMTVEDSADLRIQNVPGKQLIFSCTLKFHNSKSAKKHICVRTSRHF